jgi:hypothetical protein
MNPPPHERGGRSRFGPAQQQQYPFVVDPTEAAGAAVRAFFPARGADGEPPPPMQQGRRHHYGGGGPEISLAHGHGQGQNHLGIHHRYHQFAVEGRQDGGSPSPSASLPRHSSSQPGFFSSPVVDNGKPANASATAIYSSPVSHC